MTTERRQPRLSEHFFHREEDRSVRFRMRLSPEVASLVEDAAGDTPLMVYMARALKSTAEYHIRRREEALARGDAWDADEQIEEERA